MKKSTKAILLSAFVFPGAGQISLKRYKRAFVFIIPVLVSTIYVITGAIQQAVMILEKIEAKGSIIDINQILQIVTDVQNVSETVFLQRLFYLIMIFWIASIIDAYKIGKKY